MFLAPGSIGQIGNPHAPSEGVGGYAFVNAEASSLAARFATPPTDARKALIDNLVGSLKTASVWSKMDALYVIAAADAQAARQNWIADQYNLSAVSSPTFSPDRGYTGDGASSYLDAGVAANALLNFTQNDNSFGFWSRTNDATAGRDMGAGSQFLVIGRNVTNMQGRANSAISATFAAADSLGFYGARRNNPSDQDLFKNGAIVRLASANVSAAVGVDSVNILRTQTTYSVRQCSVAFVGGYLTDAQILAQYNAINTYLQAVGAA